MELDEILNDFLLADISLHSNGEIMKRTHKDIIDWVKGKMPYKGKGTFAGMYTSLPLDEYSGIYNRGWNSYRQTFLKNLEG